MRSSQEALDWLCLDPAATALLTDFDGTLSPIVVEPDSAYPLPGAVEALESLSAQLGAVAVVSGRPASFLVDHLGLSTDSAIDLFGLHGVEHVVAGHLEVAEAARAFVEKVRRARDEALSSVPDGVYVEDKVFAVTIHWRRSPSPKKVAGSMIELGTRLAEQNGLVPRPGKASVELVAPIGVDKGSVAVKLAEQIAKGGSLEARVAVVGDDWGDLVAFRALESLQARSRVSSLKLAVSGGGAPAELVSSADVVFEGPHEVVSFLRALADRLAR